MAPILEKHFEQGALPLDGDDAQWGQVDVETTESVSFLFFLLFVCHQVNRTIGINLDSLAWLGNPHVILCRVGRDGNALPIS
jgi:hypothetical protein